MGKARRKPRWPFKSALFCSSFFILKISVRLQESRRFLFLRKPPLQLW